MTASTSPLAGAGTAPAVRAVPASPSVAVQLGILLARLLRQLVVSPTTYVNLAISLFFLAVYTGAFGASAGFEMLIGANFLTFILPVSIVNASLAGAVAGQLLVTDLESGYLRRLRERHQLPILCLHAPFRPGRMADWPRTNPASVLATVDLARAVGAGEIGRAHV